MVSEETVQQRAEDDATKRERIPLRFSFPRLKKRTQGVTTFLSPFHLISSSERYQSAHTPRMSTTTTQNCMELEHVIGYAGNFANTCAFHPTQRDSTVYSIGATLIVGNRTDPHKQTFVQGHDADISSIALSRDGKYIASGQLGSRRHAGNAAPVLVWSFESLKNVYVFQGLKYEVNKLSFSPDGRFLAATSRNVCVIWDMEVGELVASKSLRKNITLMAWGCVSQDARSSRSSYQLNLACSSQLIINELKFDIGSLRYILTSEMCAMPTGGLVRNYTAAVVPPGRGGEAPFLLTGTENGEMCVFNTEHNIFRASLPVATNGVHAVCCESTLSDASSTCVYIGSGDGVVKQLRGADSRWKIERVVQLSGRVMSLSLRSDGGSLLAGTSQGKIYEIEMSNFSAKLLSSAHVDAINAATFTKVIKGNNLTPRSDIMCSASNDGTVQVWDLSTYDAIVRVQEASEATCVCLAQRDAGLLILSGWQDSAIRANDGTKGSRIFEIHKAHRGPVTSIDVAEKYFVSGGKDGAVNVWSWNRELLCQFSEHRKGVSAVLTDARIPYQFHSCGADGLILTYDLRMERRTVSHFQRRKTYNALVQREDGENELVVGTKCGSIQMWDRDYDAPTLTIQDSTCSIDTIAISSSGRFLALAGEAGLVRVYALTNRAGEALDKPLLIGEGEGHFTSVIDLSWAPDEKQLVSVAENASMCVWNFYGGE